MCIQHGAVAVLKKPIKVDNVLRVVPIDCQRGTPSSSASLSSQPQGTSPSSTPHIPTKQTKAVGEKSGGEAIPEPGGVPKTSPEPTPWKFTGKAMPVRPEGSWLDWLSPCEWTHQWRRQSSPPPPFVLFVAHGQLQSYRA